jgi:putative flippase GtrA
MRDFFGMLKTRIREFSWFAAIGVLNTGLHFIVLITLVAHQRLGPGASNVIGFLCANACSYYLNCRLTFRRAASWDQYFPFLICSCGGAALAYLSARLAELAHASYVIGFLITVLVTPAVNFWCVQRFAFVREKGSLQ